MFAHLASRGYRSAINQLEHTFVLWNHLASCPRVKHLCQKTDLGVGCHLFASRQSSTFGEMSSSILGIAFLDSIAADQKTHQAAKDDSLTPRTSLVHVCDVFFNPKSTLFLCRKSHHLLGRSQKTPRAMCRQHARVQRDMIQRSSHDHFSRLYHCPFLDFDDTSARSVQFTG